MNDLEFTGIRLDNGGKTFNPVTVIAIQNPVDIANLRFVNVAAQHAIVAASSRFVGEDHFELIDEGDGILDFVLQKLRE